MLRRFPSRAVLVLVLILALAPALLPTHSTNARSIPASPLVPRVAASTGPGVHAAMASPSATATATATISPTATLVLGTASPLPSTSPSPSLSPSPTASPNATASPSVSATAISSTSATATPTPAIAAASIPAPLPPAPTLAGDYAHLPLQFEPNRGQFDPQVRFAAHGPGYMVYLTADQAVLGLFPSATPAAPLARLANGRLAPPALSTTTPAAVLQVSLVGAAPQAAPVGQRPLPGTVSYFYGSDPHGWLTGLPTYGEVAYQGVYPGIDLVYYGRQTQLEYDFRLQPGADPSQVRLRLSGADGLALDRKGNLVVSLGSASLREEQPVVYQEINGRQVPVGAHYTLLGNDEVGFALGSYDSLHPLVIDPVLNYASYLGGSGWDAAQGVAIDSSGAAYLTGYTRSANFPLAGSTIFQNSNAGGYDVFVSKLNPAGTALVYSTYLGGSGNDYGEGIAVDGSGDAYITGYSTSTNYPTQSAYQATNYGNPNIILTKLAPSGTSLVYSTYLGGSGNDYGTAVAVDPSDEAYVTGYSSAGFGGHAFPTTSGAFQTINPGGPSAIVTKFSSSGTSLSYSTFLNGNYTSYGNAIAVDSSYEAYVTGNTTTGSFYPTPFPTTSGAYQSTV